MKSALKNNENIIKSGPANLQKGIETVGGKLYLTNQRLIFEAHNINTQKDVAFININEITETERSWTKFLGILPIYPNSLSVLTSNEKEYRFVLFKRNEWEAIIKEQTAL